jgi:excisionase family DNA binding protein
MPRKVFSVKHLSNMLGFSEHTVYDWVKQGKIPYLRVGHGHIRFDPAEVGRALRRNGSTPRAA